MTSPNKLTLLKERGLRVEVADNPEAITIGGVYLRKADPFRRFYLFEVHTQIKYPSVVGLGYGDEDATEVYLDGTDRSLYYGDLDDQEYPDGVPGMATLTVIPPKHTHFWHKLFHPKQRHTRPSWHVTSSDFHDKYSVEIVAWYG